MKIIAKNKIAYHDYSFEKKYEVGIVLLWHEVKSVKIWQVNIRDAIVRIQNRELWIKNMDIPLYKNFSILHLYLQKDRKLLINKENS